MIISACASPTETPAPEATAGSKTGLPGQWRTYQNPDFRYSIEVAPGWEIADAAKDEVIIFIGRPDGLSGLHILALNWSGTEEEFAQDNHNFHQRRAKVLFQPLSRTPVLMASGNMAEKFEYRVQNDSRFCIEHLVDVLLISGSSAYALQGSTCEEADALYSDIIKAMQRSFRLDSARAMIQGQP